MTFDTYKFKKAILMRFNNVHPTPSLFISPSDEGNLSPHSDYHLYQAANIAVDAANAKGSPSSRGMSLSIWNTIFGASHSETEDYGGKGQGLVISRRPRWRFRWGPNGERIPMY